MDHYGHLVSEKAERGSGPFIVYLIYVLDFEEVIAGAEGPLLCAASLISLLTYEIGVGALDAAAGFNPVEIGGLAVTVLYRPSCALDKKLLLVLRTEAYLSF